MPTPNIPLTYAVKSGSTIHLYILIYAGSQPGFPSDGEPSGKTKLYAVTAGSTGSTPYPKHYAFAVDSFTDIKVLCDGHVRHMEIADLDQGSAPDASADGKAYEAPYAYTQKVDANKFVAEIAIFSESPQRFDCNHNDPAEPDSNTSSSIVINPQVSAGTAFSVSQEFNVISHFTTNGVHEVAFGDPPKRRTTKTKNRNHSATPFPKKKHPPKSAAATTKSSAKATSGKPKPAPKPKSKDTLEKPKAASKPKSGPKKPQ